jgi:hypothetical protein
MHPVDESTGGVAVSVSTVPVSPPTVLSVFGPASSLTEYEPGSTTRLQAANARHTPVSPRRVHFVFDPKVRSLELVTIRRSFLGLSERLGGCAICVT